MPPMRCGARRARPSMGERGIANGKWQMANRNLIAPLPYLPIGPFIYSRINEIPSENTSFICTALSMSRS